MQRLTPYLFFLIAALTLVMIALNPNDDWASEEVDMLDAVLVIAGVLIGAHLLRKLVGVAYARWQDRRK